MRRLLLSCAVLLGLTAVVPGMAPAGAQSGAASDVIDAAYEGLLGRSPEPAGLAHWEGLVQNGVRLGDVVGAIGDADEHRRFIVRGAYQRILDRQPEDAGLEFWSEGIIDNFTARSLAIELYASEEFYLRAGGTDDSFVAALYANVLNRQIEPAGLQYWTGLLTSGTPTRAVIDAILSSAEGVLQPELSIEDALPGPRSVGGTDSIRIDLDRPVDPRATSVIVSVGGRRVSGAVSGDPEDPSVVRFTARSVTNANPGEKVVVTVFATTIETGPPPAGVPDAPNIPADSPPSQTPTTVVPSAGTTVESVDYSYTFDPGAAPLPGPNPTEALIVAFYGHPRTPVLGVAGEGTPAEALSRLQAQAAPYAVTGRTIVPAFEMIATLVTAGPGADNLYRSRATEAELRPYLDTVRTADGIMILDIQPGRADVLDEAIAYEALLNEPDVGLALDPEWVVGPNQTPKGRIGVLDAADINRVSAYLADLVAANNLPPKILIIHQFKPSMVSNPDNIVSRPGVRILFHADGEGGPAAKLADYDDLLPKRFEKGIKIFYDEDSPTMTPEQLLARTNPDPNFISYQ